MGVELVLEEGGAFIEDAFAACPTLEGSLGVLEEASAPRVGAPSLGGAVDVEPQVGAYMGVELVLAEGGAFISEEFAAFFTSNGPLDVLVDAAVPRGAAGVAEVGVGAEPDGVDVAAVEPVGGFLGPPRRRGAGREASSGCPGWDGPGFPPGEGE